MLSMNDHPNSPVEPTQPERGYGGVRITAPRRTPKSPGAAGIGVPDLARQITVALPIGPEQQARILTGAAIFGVFAIILLHEFGHWFAGLAVTGRFPDFYIVAVRQKVEQFSTAGGIFTWGAGPVAQAAVIWVVVLLASARGERSPRLLVIAGGAIIFTLVTHIFVWLFAAFSSPDSWGNDLPRVATFLGSGTDSTQRLWMHLLNAAYSTAILSAAYRWWKLVRVTSRTSLFASSSAIGAFEGGIVVVVATLFLALSN